ncbi:hypothetical protein BJ165DRAFT_1511396, partial [Panaeolus papilionaceus]
MSSGHGIAVVGGEKKSITKINDVAGVLSLSEGMRFVITTSYRAGGSLSNRN